MVIKGVIIYVVCCSVCCHASDQYIRTLSLVKRQLVDCQLVDLLLVAGLLVAGLLTALQHSLLTDYQQTVWYGLTTSRPSAITPSTSRSFNCILLLAISFLQLAPYLLVVRLLIVLAIGKLSVNFQLQLLFYYLSVVIVTMHSFIVLYHFSTYRIKDRI